jgi:homoserine O-acetyltransferase
MLSAVFMASTDGKALAETFATPFAGESTPAATQHDVLYKDYKFRNGETMETVHLHYATMGTPHRNAAGEIDNAVLMLHWTGSGGSALLSDNYVRSLFAPGKPLDAKRYYLIFPDNFGHGASSKPSDGLHAKFPNYGYGDLVNLQHRLVAETLGIKRLHVILGVSMGGMNAWQWAETYPNDVEAIIPVVSFPAKVSGRNLLWRRMVIDEIRSDPTWDGGDYKTPPLGWLHGYRILRMMIEGVPHMQRIIGDGKAANEVIAATDRQAASSDANDTLYSLMSSSDYDPEPSLSKIKAKVFALNFDDDEFNPNQLNILQTTLKRIPHAEYVVQPGNADSFGHLTMTHPELWWRRIGTFMKKIERD